MFKLHKIALVAALVLLGCETAGQSTSQADEKFQPKEYDAQIEQEDLPDSVEARAYFAGSYFGFPRGAEVFVEQLYQKGAPKVWVYPEDIEGKSIPSMLIVQLPSVSAHRVETYAVLKSFSEKFETEPPEGDRGTRYEVLFLQGD